MPTTLLLTCDASSAGAYMFEGEAYEVTAHDCQFYGGTWSLDNHCSIDINEDLCKKYNGTWDPADGGSCEVAIEQVERGIVAAPDKLAARSLTEKQAASSVAPEAAPRFAAPTNVAACVILVLMTATLALAFGHAARYVRRSRKDIDRLEREVSYMKRAQGFADCEKGTLDN